MTSDSSEVTAGTVVTRPDGVKVTMPKDWSKMSISDLAAVGITPGMAPGATATSPVVPNTALATGTGTTTFQPRSGGLIQPLTSSGASGYVSILVIGSGLVINNWYTSADHPTNEYLCTFPAYWGSMSTIAFTGEEACGSSGTFYGNGPGVYVYNQTGYACNTWVSIAGKACVHITP